MIIWDGFKLLKLILWITIPLVIWLAVMHDTAGWWL